MRTNAFGSGVDQFGGGFGKGRGNRGFTGFEVMRGLGDGVGLEQNIAARELAMRIVTYVSIDLNSVAITEPARRRLSEDGFNLGLSPDIEGAFALFVWMRGIDHAVGIFGGKESALRMSHVANHVIE